MNQMKVAILYRVSTERQGAEDDIPMQKAECQSFALKNNWHIVEELTEKQSGYSTAIEDRETLLQIREMAQQGEINIVLAYMSDRLGRQTELAGFVQGLALLGVKVYTVKEGLISGGTHGDNLMTYIRFWMAEGESMKTSERVKDSIRQLNEEGFYMGGGIPFGYRLIDTGEKHNSKKTKTIRKIVPDEEEVEVVKLIFNLVFEKGYGAGRISQYLNDKGYTNRGKIFRHNTVSRILRNPVYIGYKRFNMFQSIARSKKKKALDRDEWKLQPYNEELVIIPEHVFQRVQEIIDSRRSTQKNCTVVKHSAVLLSGLLVCGKCGKRLHTDFCVKSYTRKSDGVVTNRKVYRYTCDHARSVPEHGKKQWGSKTLDKIVEDQVLSFISGLNFDDFDSEIKSFKDSHIKIIEKELKQVSTMKLKAQKGLDNAKQELKNIMMGDSAFTKEDISEMIQTFTQDLEQYSQKEQVLMNQLQDNQLSLNDIESLKERFSNFGDVYKEADHEQKKMLIGSVVKEITVVADKITIHFKIGITGQSSNHTLNDGELWADCLAVQGQEHQEAHFQDSWGWVDSPIAVPNVASTHPQKDKTFADLVKHKAIEFVVEVPA